MPVIIKNLSENEVGEFVSVLQEAALWLKNEGQEMWDVHQLTPDHLLKHNSIDELFIGYINDEVAAVMILQEEDKIFWPDVANDSLFLHKLAVRRKYSKQGVSIEMINWAKLQARIRNKKYVRLDCAADRPKLCHFYESQGFRQVGEKVMFGNYPIRFYEFAITGEE